MDFRTSKIYKISNEAITSRDYGIFDNIVFIGDHPLSDSEIVMIDTNLDSIAKNKAVL